MRQDHRSKTDVVLLGQICRAFSELRQEVVILSQLQHPCLVSLLGVSVRPSLLVLLELAAMGSLRSVLNDNMKDRSFNKYRDKGKTFSAVFPKDITFKMVYQVWRVTVKCLHHKEEEYALMIYLVNLMQGV